MLTPIRRTYMYIIPPCQHALLSRINNYPPCRFVALDKDFSENAHKYDIEAHELAHGVAMRAVEHREGMLREELKRTQRQLVGQLEKEHAKDRTLFVSVERFHLQQEVVLTLLTLPNLLTLLNY